MKAHTFQKGDRVYLHGDKKASGVVIHTPTAHDTSPPQKYTWVKRDDNCHPNGKFWTCDYKHLTHDTNIQLGDWVRHESVDGKDEIYDGRIFHVEWATGGSLLCFVKNHPALWRVNCVKIQPPQEGKMESVEEVQKAIDALVKLKAQLGKKEEKPLPQFYVNGHGPYSEVEVIESNPKGPYYILRVTNDGVTRSGGMGYPKPFAMDKDGKIALDE